MSADLLRQAAVAMRTDANREAILRDGDNYWETEASLFERRMTPAVALAVADWLDRVLANPDVWGYVVGGREFRSAVAVARAYLGRDEA